jgi:hypothetical protein
MGCGAPAEVISEGEDLSAPGEREELELAADPPFLPLEVAPHQSVEVLPAAAPRPPSSARARLQPRLIGQPVHHSRRECLRGRDRRRRGEQ